MRRWRFFFPVTQLEFFPFTEEITISPLNSSWPSHLATCKSEVQLPSWLAPTAKPAFQSWDHIPSSRIECHLLFINTRIEFSFFCVCIHVRMRYKMHMNEVWTMDSIQGKKGHHIQLCIYKTLENFWNLMDFLMLSLSIQYFLMTMIVTPYIEV